MTMTSRIQQQITKLENTKAELRTSIMEKGVTVQPSDLFSTYPTRISQITTTPGDKDSLFTDLIDRSITSFTIPTGTTTIVDDRFFDCSDLTDVTLPDTVVSIGERAFKFCRSLTSIDIPSSVTTIGAYAFQDCRSLTSITCNSTIPPTIGEGTFFQTTCQIYVPAASVQAYKTAWPQYETRIQAIVTNEVFNSIVDRSISGDFVIPDGVTAVNHFAFYWCQSLTSVTIPSSVTAIGYSSFESCKSLTSITCLATTPPALQYDYTFYDTNNCPIYVPAESVSAYQSASGWSAYASRITAIQ